MNYKRFLSAIMGLFILACWVTKCKVFAQLDQVVAGDGIPTTVPENIDSVLFYSCPKKLTLKEVKEQWEQIRCPDYIIRQMGPIRHEQTLDFLYRVASVDPSLYKNNPFPKRIFGEWALTNMLRMKHPSLPEKLTAILHAPFTGIPAEEVRKIKGKAAQMLLSYKNADKKLIFAVLDKNAQEGYILCPYPYPKYGYDNGRGKDWKDSPTEPEARELLRKWLVLKNRTTRIEAALCAARAGILDVKIREIAETEIGDIQALPKYPSHEWSSAEYILQILAAHNDLQAEEKYDRIQVEREIKDCSPLGVPAEDKICRERREKKFKEKWKK